jgi:hypothetical protein
MEWYLRNWDLDFILEQGLKYHATYFMPKSARLPDKWMDKLSAFCRKLGYRFVLRHALFYARVARNSTFAIQCWIDNVGVAPIYRPYAFALRLRQRGHEEIISVNDVDIRAWLPGDVWLDKRVTLPAGLQQGWAELSAALIDPESRRPAVRFAVREQFSDGWVPLGGIEVY